MRSWRKLGATPAVRTREGEGRAGEGWRVALQPSRRNEVTMKMFASAAKNILKLSRTALGGWRRHYAWPTLWAAAGQPSVHGAVCNSCQQG